MRLLVFFLIGCTSGPPSVPTDPATPSDTPTEPTAVPTPPAGDAGFSLDVLSVNYEIADSWSFLETESITYRIEGTWWNSDACGTCSAAMVAVRASSVVDCEDLPTAGAFPGGSFQYGWEIENPGVGVFEDSLHLVEGVSCATLGPAPSGEPMAALGSLTIEADTSFVVTDDPPTAEVDVFSPITVTFASDIDATASANASVALTNASGGLVNTTVAFNGPDLTVMFDGRLATLEAEYTLAIEGLVATSGAVQPAPYSHAFQTELFDDSILYRFTTSVGAAGDALMVDGAGQLVLADTTAFPSRGLWRMVTSGSGYTMQSQSDTGQRLTASSSGDRPGLAPPNAGSTTQVWRFTPGATSDSYRIALGALTDADVIGGPPAALVVDSIGTDPIQSWTPTETGVWLP